MKQRWKDQEFRDNNHIRMTQNNPARLPDYRNKVVKTMMDRGGYSNNFIAGNGKISKVEQLIYQEMIKRGFVYNYAIPTGEAINKFPDRRYARNYKPDFTLIGKKICVEIDGDEHLPEQDKKKDECLRYLGFTVFRFKNQEVENTLSQVLEEVDKIVREVDR